MRFIIPSSPWFHPSLSLLNVHSILTEKHVIWEEVGGKLAGDTPEY